MMNVLDCQMTNMTTSRQHECHECREHSKNPSNVRSDIPQEHKKAPRVC